MLAPTVRYITLGVILDLVAYRGHEFKQMDVVTNFLNAEVASDVYMEEP